MMMMTTTTMVISRKKQQLMIATMIITLAIMARRLISDARIINITNALNSKKILIVHYIMKPKTTTLVPAP
ncbi:unnamed protein product [Linum trigynum]|uniref:Secreted protein n=1 Tax=Linum trigynum TaxID=586398 RepID=A0AAV2CSK3_9ROSI